MDRPTARTEIRPAGEADAPAIARIVAEALGDKYRPALGGRSREAIEALVRLDVREPQTMRRWVAEIDGRIAGVVSVAIGADVDTTFPRTIAEAVGWPRAIRATLVLSVLAHGRLAPDEAYVDELAVDAWARRRGVARALLETCADQARAAGRRRLTLWVTIDNEAGRGLYAATGFAEARRRRWLAGRLLFKAPGAILMERRLAPAPARDRPAAADPAPGTA